MCGVAFYFSKIKHYEEEIKDSLKSLSHRGPDGTGLKFYEDSSGYIGIGHNRLKIIDLSENAAQPMDSKGGTVLSYNGEIYNFKELKASLVKQGITFRTSSDTEVIIKIYEKYGVDGFTLLQGMFAFIIYDQVRKKIFVVRDSVGIKPIYFFKNDNEFFCSSEIKGLKAFSEVNLKINEDDVFEFFNHGFLYEPNTGFHYIKKINPSSYLEVDIESGKIIEIDYTTLLDDVNDSKLGDLIEASVTKQTFADVQVGTFFSGGTDSSIIAAIQNSKDLLFARYETDERADIDNKFSEAISKFLSKKLLIENLSSEEKTQEKILEEIDFIAKNSEEPISDFTFYPSYLLARKARELGYTVMLSGMGGDEAFGGYPRYLVTKYHKLLIFLYPLIKLTVKYKIYPKNLDKRIERLVSYLEENEWELAYSRLLGFFDHRELNGLFSNSALLNKSLIQRLSKLNVHKDKDKFKQAQFMDSIGFLSHNLLVADKSSMLASIEVRVPLLDEAVYKKGLLSSSSTLIPFLNLKKLLKEYLGSLMPRKLVKRPKTGFNPPLEGMIRILGPEVFKENLHLASLYINTVYAEYIIDQHFSGKSNNTYKLWQLIYFCRWLRSNTP